MLFHARIYAVAAILSTLANGLPLDTRDIVPRQKSYEVINVDGGTTQAPPPETTKVKTTKTVEIINPGPTVTVVKPAPAPAVTSSTSTSSTSSTPTITSSSSSSVSTPIETPKPVFVTVTVPVPDGPTEYYDDGMWHTKYRVKTFEAVVVTTIPTASSSTILPVLETPAVSYIATEE